MVNLGLVPESHVKNLPGSHGTGFLFLLDNVGRGMLVVNRVLEAFDESCETRVGFHFFLDALDGVNHSGVVLAAKAGTDGLQADGGAFAHQVHGHLASL